MVAEPHHADPVFSLTEMETIITVIVRDDELDYTNVLSEVVVVVRVT